MFQYICGTIRRTFKRNNMITVFKLYNIVAVSTLLCGLSNWTVQKKHRKRTEVVQMKYLSSCWIHIT